MRLDHERTDQAGCCCLVRLIKVALLLLIFWTLTSRHRSI